MPGDFCGDCGQQFVWDAEASSGVCPHCGTLQDPSQNVLAAYLDGSVGDENQVRYEHVAASSSNASRPTTLKSIRNSDRGWDLPGQGKAAYAERAKYSMRSFTAALALRIGHPGLTARAQLLFDQAMEKGRFRWGRKAKLVSGASMFVALREARKGETLRDISYLIDETPVQLARALTLVLGLLQIKLTAADPSWFFPTLQKHLVGMLAQQPSSLPVHLARALKSIHLPAAMISALSLSDLVSRASILPNTSSSIAACAIYILSLEGETLTSLPNCTELAKLFGKRFGVSGDMIMRVYKTIYEEVCTWASSVPWLGDVAGGSSVMGGKKTVKLSKRVAMARTLKDVIQYQERLWQAQLMARPPLSIASDDASEEADVSLTNTGSSARIDVQRDSHRDMPLAGTQQWQQTVPVRCKKRTRKREIDALSRFFLSPPDVCGNDGSKRARSDRVNALRPDALVHFLTSDAPDFGRQPTRLQLLVCGKRADDISDDELFGENELENMLRSEQEMEALMKTWDWAGEKKDGDGDDDSEEGHALHARRRDRDRGGTSRVNMEALQRLLAESDQDAVPQEAIYDDDQDECEEEWKDWTNMYGLEEDFEMEIREEREDVQG